LPSCFAGSLVDDQLHTSCGAHPGEVDKRMLKRKVEHLRTKDKTAVVGGKG
jgi:hypothetical protein